MSIDFICIFMQNSTASFGIPLPPEHGFSRVKDSFIKMYIIVFVLVILLM